LSSLDGLIASLILFAEVLVSQLEQTEEIFPILILKKSIEDMNARNF